MRACLYTTSFLDGKDGQGNDRLERNLKYLEYYGNLRDQLGFERMVFADNGSSEENRSKLMTWARIAGLDVTMLTFDPIAEIPAKVGVFHYPYCWRGLYAMEMMIDAGFDKIINIDSDCFVLTQKAADYIKGLDSGWTTFWCRKYRFPENAAHILCKDAFPRFLDFTRECKWEDRATDKPMEKVLPFTHIDKELSCDRWGESKFKIRQNAHQDIYCQTKIDIELVFNKYSSHPTAS